MARMLNRLLESWKVEDVKINKKALRLMQRAMMRAVLETTSEYFIFGMPYEEFVAWRRSCRAWNARWYVTR